MKIENIDDICSIRLPMEFTIAKIETNREAVRKHLLEPVKCIEIHAEDLKELDTACFQLLLSLKLTAKQKGIPFVVSGKTDEIDRVCLLYGCSLISETNSEKPTESQPVKKAKRRKLCQKQS